MNTSAIVHVAVAVIENHDNGILISLRAEHLHQGGLWEFPGGKVEAGETVAEALSRELKEELAISILECEPLTEVIHDYGDKCVRLDVWRVKEFSGSPEGREGQSWRWIDRTQLAEFQFPVANSPIIEILLDELT